MFGKREAADRLDQFVVVFTLLLVDGEHHEHGHPRRFRELAFLRRWAIAEESCSVFILAGALAWRSSARPSALAVPGLSGRLRDLQKLTRGFLLYFEVTARIIATGGVVATLLAIVAAIARPSPWRG